MTFAFRCDAPNFKIRSAPPDVILFDVQRECLAEGSEIFRDMFACCGADDTDPLPVMDLAESAESIGVLLRLLHHPPKRWAHADGQPTPGTPAEAAIPLPILKISLEFADKYALAPAIVENLQSHLVGHVDTAPLQVYGLASALGLGQVASRASENLLHPPVSSYSLAQIKELPDAASLHRLVVLQARREPLLREVLLNEPLFPHDYGRCANHGKRLAASWDARKAALAPKVKAGTDVAAEMEGIMDETEGCETCKRASVAAVEMLRYKAKKVIHKTSQLRDI